MSKQRKSTSKAPAKGNPAPLPLPRGLVASLNEGRDAALAALVPQVVIHHPPGRTFWPETNGLVRGPEEDEESFERRAWAGAEPEKEMMLRNKHNATTVQARTAAELAIESMETPGETNQRLLMEKWREEDEDRRAADAEAKAKAQEEAKAAAEAQAGDVTQADTKGQNRAGGDAPENRCPPLSKTEIAKRIFQGNKNARPRKAMPIMEAHDLRPQGNKWTIRLDPDLGQDVITRLKRPAP